MKGYIFLFIDFLDFWENCKKLFVWIFENQFLVTFFKIQISTKNLERNGMLNKGFYFSYTWVV